MAGTTATLTLPRDPSSGTLVLPGLRAQLSADFLLDTVLPSWLTATADAVALSTIASGQGDLSLTTAAVANSFVRLDGPTIDLSKVNALLWELDGIATSNTGSTGLIRYFLGVQKGTEQTVGASASWAVNTKMGSLGAHGGSVTVDVNYNAVADGEAGRRRSLGLLILPKQKHVYLLTGDQVITDAYLPDLALGLAAPYIQMNCSNAAGHGLLISRARLTVWKSTAVTFPVFGPVAPTALTLDAAAGSGKVTVAGIGGAGASVTYALYRSATATGTPIASGTSIFPFTDTGVTNGAATSYTATATNPWGVTTSNTVTATPSGTAGAAITVDNFTAADGTAVTGRSAADGPSAYTWSVDNGTFTIVGNAARVASGNGAAYATIDTGRTDVRVSATYPLLNGDSTKRRVGIVARYVDPSNYYRVVTRSSDGKWVLDKLSGGAATVLAVGPASASGDAVALVVTGSRLSAYVNGSLIGSVTDTSNATGTRQGSYGSYTNSAGSVAQDRVSTVDGFTVSNL